MQKWEYCYVKCHQDGTHWKARWLTIGTSGQQDEEIRDWKRYSLAGFTNGLGAEGWELVGVGVGGYDLAFKRQIA